MVGEGNSQEKKEASLMTRVIVAASPIYGHFAPMHAIAADLVRRGHQVTVTTGSNYRGAVEAVGARFAALLGAADFDGDDVAALFPEILSIAPGPEQIAFGLRHLFMDPVPDQHRTVQELLAAAGDEPVVLLHETGFLGAWPVLLGAAGARPAAVVGLGVVPLTISSQDTAPFGLGLPPDSSPEGRERNRAANTMVREAVFGSTQEHLVKVLASCGATEPVPFVMDGMSRLPDRFLQLSIAQLDYPRGDLPDSIRYVGALPAGPGRASELPEWWDEVASARRVVVVSQGTAANVDFTELVQPTLDALADLDVLVIATLGREAELERVPANARVAEFIPFDDLLPHTDVLVSNGGFGGVQQALGHGVPMVLAGQTEDKTEVTARAAWAGAAINLATQRPQAQDVRAAVEKVLTEAACRERAAELAAEYARHDALTAIHETVLELGR
ncbi:nucleotide disphospho-sugar-binding domain-containing protein [Streptomyces sp. NPDC048282]|uniref:nucleotide disphospho-sugar-binding domain-containing protein n=1 Tax=Streptomyces sp. NPDC048282 TaxID=3365528 RepID=UPI003712B156